MNLPVDYEPCGECGFDHEYEYAEAYRWHQAEGTHENAFRSWPMTMALVVAGAALVALVGAFALAVGA